jgi:trans-aconitate methyltransferase
MEKRLNADNWNATLYDEKHSFVSSFGEDLVELLAPRKGESILDLGCGTGELANKLSQMGVTVSGIDKSENMILQAQKKYPNLNFSVQDAIKLNYSNEFDAVFSNATLHWVKNAKQALFCIFTSLKDGGRFVAELGGKGNVQFITNEIINQFESLGIPYKSEHFPWYYPSIGEYSSLMEEAGFKVTFAHHFHRPTPLIGENGLKNWIEMFAISMFEGLSKEIIELIISRVETNLHHVLFRDGQWIADYKRLRVIGIKE